MINLDEGYLMMIHPHGPTSGPLCDHDTILAERVAGLAHQNGLRMRGFHICCCGEQSDNVDHILPDGTVTNSLLVHYVRDHRHEVPPGEMEKLRRLASNFGLNY